MSEALTWQKLVELEPRLQALLDEARSAADGKESFCAFDKWYGSDGPRSGLKQKVMQLVGWERKPPSTLPTELLLQSHTAYDVAYQTIYGALSDCRNADCDCMG